MPSSSGAANPGSQRLFFALWPDPVVRARLAALLPGLAAQTGQAVAADNLHLTLAFLGNVSPAQRQCMEAWAGRLGPVALNLTLDRLGYWPGPRVAWLGPSRWPEALDALALAFAEGMRHCGLRPDHRSYTPHITLLRKARALPDAPADLPISWQTQGFVLCESRSGEAGVEYRVLRRWE